ncbi:MAG: hypothetical protein K2O65_09200 [Lachnospiraceae bacterium]|nr:hypothetical protein [Lachnospiraceae bacterium]
MKKGIIAAISSVVGASLGVCVVRKSMGDELCKYKGYAEKHMSLYLMMNQWVKIKQDNKSVSKYLEEQGFKNIAIYGMSYAGETLYNELKGTKINVEYGIDRNPGTIYTDLNVVSPDDDLQDVDVVIVTAITYFDEIEEMLSEKMNCPIFSLEDILYEL